VKPSVPVSVIDVPAVPLPGANTPPLTLVLPTSRHRAAVVSNARWADGSGSPKGSKNGNHKHGRYDVPLTGKILSGLIGMPIMV